jgi:hypothetical protein
MAIEGTKFQINYKLADGTLINIYAATQAELEVGLTTIQDTSSLIASTSAALGNAGAIQNLAASLGATPVAAPSPVQPVYAAAPAAAPAYGHTPPDGHCKHGALVWRESKPGAPKAWKGWFCPSAKGTPDQCEPKFVR